MKHPMSPPLIWLRSEPNRPDCHRVEQRYGYPAAHLSPGSSGTHYGVFEYVYAFLSPQRSGHDPGGSFDHDHRVHRHGRACSEPYPQRRGRETAICPGYPARRKGLRLSPGRAGSQQKRHRPGRGGDTESDAVEKQAGKGAGVLPGSAPL